MLQTSITPEGRFRVGVHTPSYSVTNLREHDHRIDLGLLPDNTRVDNRDNFPAGNIDVEKATPIYEILNPLPFRGCTFIDSAWAGKRAADSSLIRIARAPEVSLRSVLEKYSPQAAVEEIIRQLPLSLRYALAATSTDAEELTWLARSCCALIFNTHGEPVGLQYHVDNGQKKALIDDFDLFETIANNPHLPDRYKEVMVLRPGVQGDSSIVGDYRSGETEVFEYLRTNSYIPWGHYAANFAHTCIHYTVAGLSGQNLEGLRHLYYQRMFVAAAERLGLPVEIKRRRLTPEELEQLRQQIMQRVMVTNGNPESLATLWGWNFGYDFSASGYRLHASHQMIHQQYAMVPQWVDDASGGRIPAYCCGDLVADVVERYRQDYQSDFFDDYIKAILGNTRTDGGPGEQSLVIWRDKHVLLFVPKAQVSQWEMQLMVTADCEHGPIGTCIEADAQVRQSLDAAILKAQQILAGLGATMVTSIEYSKRIGIRNRQRLLYAFLPKLPWAMGGFSEAQGRYILGHYPEDFATACRQQLG